MNPRLLSDAQLDSLANVADDPTDQVIPRLLRELPVNPSQQAQYGG